MRSPDLVASSPSPAPPNPEMQIRGRPSLTIHSPESQGGPDWNILFVEWVVLMVKGNGNGSGWLPHLMSMSQANRSRKTGALNETAVSREEMSSAPLRSFFFFFFGTPQPWTHTQQWYCFSWWWCSFSAFSYCIILRLDFTKHLSSESVAKTTKPQWTQQLSFGCFGNPTPPPPPPPLFAGDFLFSLWHFLLSGGRGSLETRRLCDSCKVL